MSICYYRQHKMQKSIQIFTDNYYLQLYDSTLNKLMMEEVSHHPITVEIQSFNGTRQLWLKVDPYRQRYFE